MMTNHSHNHNLAIAIMGRLHRCPAQEVEIAMLHNRHNRHTEYLHMKQMMSREHSPQ